MNLIICCDGTWNTSDAMEDGLSSPTNVVKFFNDLAADEENGGAREAY
ncbi:uncharacterized protein (DUF2235 family) [Pseudorhizobium tarimense]|uniref:Uncharacterized protein (DUF2235 family) n=1 Tax=Pseudorhizobium tarimense TaxID=1079109 RepID=A0ABV2H6Y2_9HYPH